MNKQEKVNRTRQKKSISKKQSERTQSDSGGGKSYLRNINLVPRKRNQNFSQKKPIKGYLSSSGIPIIK